MTALAGGAVLIARVGAMSLVVALPLFAGYMFTDRVLWAGVPALACSLLACVASALGAREVRRGLGAATCPLAGLLAWSLVATVHSVYLHASLVALASLAACVALLAVFASVFRDERWRRWAWITIAGAGAVEGILGLRDWTQTVIFQGDPSWRIFGTMFNPNVLAGYLLAAIPAAVVTLAIAWRRTASEGEDRPRLALIAAGFAVLIPCAALLLTGSRAGLLGAILGAGVIVLAMPTRVPRRWLVAGAVALVALMVLAPPVRNRLLSASTQSHSAIFRWYTWQGAAHMIAARPLLGFGPGSFEHAYPRFALVGFTRMAHQTPLQIAAEAGLPALLLMAAGVAMIGGILVRGLRAGGLGALEAAAGLGALAAVGLQNLADYTWYVPAVGMTLSATVGLALAAARDAEGGDESTKRRPWLSWAACAGLALVVIIGCGIGLRAQTLAGRGRALIAQGRYSMAAGWLRQAAGIDPLDAETWEDLGQASAGSGPGGVERALQARLRAAEVNPLSAGNYLALSALYDALDQPDSALAAAERAIEVQPNWPRAYVVLALLPVGRYEAIDEVTDYSYAYAWLALGAEAEASGDAEAAADYYERAVALAGEFARLHRGREEMRRALGTWDEAEVVEAERLRDQAEAGVRHLPDAGEGTG